MGKFNHYKTALGAFISSEKGQRFFNFAYSIGAAIVIWGALFKILHLPGGNALLSIGMGTEVLMFVLTAFDRPPKEYRWEEVFPALKHKDDDDEAHKADTAALAAAQATGAPAVQGAGGGGGVFIGGGGISIDGAAAGGSGSAAGGQGGVIVLGSGGGIAADSSQAVAATSPAEANEQYIDKLTEITAEMERLCATTSALNKVSETLLAAYEAITQHSSEINESATGYVDQMQSLNRNISGLNTIYEIQLKSVSSQIDAIDRVNRGIKDIRDMYEKSASQSTRYCEETEKMARYMQQLNKVYEKMIHAMTINAFASGMAVPSAPEKPEAEHEA